MKNFLSNLSVTTFIEKKAVHFLTSQIFFVLDDSIGKKIG